MDFTTISRTVEDGILTLTLDRPEHLNSFTAEMADELERTFREVNEDDAVRAVVVTGSGRAFCAGMDLTAEGNVFGLDESMDPGLADMADLTDEHLIRGVRDTGGRVTLAVGATVIAVGYLSAAAFAANPWQLLIATCIACAGVGIGYAAMPTLIMENCPANEAGSGVGVNALMRSMGTTIAGAVMALVLTSRLTDLGGGVQVPAEEMFRLCFLMGAGAAIAGALVVLLIPRIPASAEVEDPSAPAVRELAAVR